jgi:hypothetical protein
MTEDHSCGHIKWQYAAVSRGARTQAHYLFLFLQQSICSPQLHRFALQCQQKHAHSVNVSTYQA